MYAIVEIAGQQFKVQKDQRLFVHRMEANEGDKVSFDKVMLTDDNGKVTVGAPVIDGLAVNAKVLKHLKGDKVLVFKKKRRKGYQKMNGHRQYFTEIVIEDIGAGTKTAKPAKKEEVKEAAPKAAAPKAEPSATKAAPKAKAPAKKAAAPKAEKKKETKKED
ncbi:MAG: 50S ribosomal protein L21 [Flavobacteriales bacterium]|nr:50S ribosomal protein L21 [Flavobacteriales bacterium]